MNQQLINLLSMPSGLFNMLSFCVQNLSSSRDNSLYLDNYQLSSTSHVLLYLVQHVLRTIKSISFIHLLNLPDNEHSVLLKIIC